jgi:segregation and condensation protein B
MEVQLEKEVALIETVLFLESEPMDEAALSRATGLAPEIVALALEALREELATPVHGLEPVQSGGGWILAPKVELWEVLKDRYGKKADSRLSRAALETLSIIAYSQPITRAEVESLRGVSADGMVRFLLEKELIKEVGKKEAPGRPVQYGTTREFLKYFRLGSIADLPKLDELDRERFDDEDEVDTSAESATAALAAAAPDAEGPVLQEATAATEATVPEVEVPEAPAPQEALAASVEVADRPPEEQKNEH